MSDLFSYLGLGLAIVGLALAIWAKILSRRARRDFERDFPQYSKKRK